MVDAAVFSNGLGKKEVSWTVFFPLSLWLFQSWLGAARESDRERQPHTHKKGKICWISPSSLKKHSDTFKSPFCVPFSL